MNYPGGIKHKVKNDKSTKINTNYGNRGMTLENELNSSNDYYRLIDKAIIYKKPTPIKITNVDYPSRDKAVIKEAYFTVPSTTDYNGIYKGKYIDFEAKETKSSTNFTLRNIHPHQIEHLKSIEKHGGIAFIIVRFTILNETYLMPINKLEMFLDNNNRKSIPIDYFRENCYLIKDNLKPTVDYLKIIDKLMEEKNG
ncbi:MAG: Holliday junction resolvase RecU [Bacilli bacterium]|nr:Holliday junction resolvase RecU [Bacilli bacterium]